MKGSLLAFSSLYVAVFSFMIGIGLLGTYLPFRLSLAGDSPEKVGLVMSSYFLGMFFGALVCPKLIRLVGHIRAFTAFAAATTAVVMGHGLLVSAGLWAVLRFFAGLSTIGLYTVIESWLNECTEPRERGKVLSVYMIVSYLGMGIGQQFLHLGPNNDEKPLLIAGLTLVLCIIPVSVTRSIHPEIPEFHRVGILEIMRRTPTGVLGCLTAGLLNGAFYAVAPIFCYQTGLSLAHLAQTMSVTILGGLLLQWPIGILSDLFDRAYVLAFIGTILCFICGGIALVPDQQFSLFLLAMMIFGGFLFTLYPVSIARAHDVGEPARIVPMSSMLLLVYSLGATAGPILATLAMRFSMTPYGFFIYCAAVSGLYAAVVFFLRGRELVQVVPVADHTEFVPLKSTSPVAVYIDPRLDEDAQPEAGDDTREQ